MLKSKQPELQTITVKQHLLKKTLAELRDKGCKIQSVVKKDDGVWEISYYPPENDI